MDEHGVEEELGLPDEVVGLPHTHSGTATLGDGAALTALSEEARPLPELRALASQRLPRTARA